ncbi:phosphatase PAP2 family protein [Peribacillus frigoritolerans]|uniref:phosphatase PAP2 family protein n=1 Tax=Peribacillus frigoritolerans TaxID=450367 RepID=UPI00399D51A8
MGIGFVCLVLLIGVSRIVMKVHFPTDILAGFALGAAYSLILFKLYKFNSWDLDALIFRAHSFNIIFYPPV